MPTAFYEKRFDTILDRTGRVVLNAQVRVLEYPGGGLATIYSDPSGVDPIANPLVADDDGFFEYYAADGRYTWEITTNVGTRTINDILHGSGDHGLEGEGFVVALNDGEGGYITRSLVAPAAGLAITNADGIDGNAIFALANDLAALEALTGTGIPRRTATDTWELGEVTGITIFALRDTGSIAVSITAGTDKAIFEGFPGCEAIAIWAGAGTTSSSGNVVIDVHVDGTTIMSANKLTIEEGDTLTQEAGTQPALTTTTFPDLCRVTIDYDSAGTGCKAVTVYIAAIVDESNFA